VAGVLHPGQMAPLVFGVHVWQADGYSCTRVGRPILRHSLPALAEPEAPRLNSGGAAGTAPERLSEALPEPPRADARVPDLVDSGSRGLLEMREQECYGGNPRGYVGCLVTRAAVGHGIVGGVR
jgi:hypothetical protein